MHIVYPPHPPPKLCITIVLDFSWDNCHTQEKLETMVMQNLGGGRGGGNKKHYDLCESSELKIGQEVQYTSLNHLQLVNKLSLMDK